MTALQDELERFHRFATEQLAQGAAVDSLDELLLRWQDPDVIQSAIERGLRDIEQGRFERVEACNRALRQEFGLPEQ